MQTTYGNRPGITTTDDAPLCVMCNLPVADDEHADEKIDLHIGCEAEYDAYQRDEAIDRLVDDAIARKHGVTL